MLFKRAKYLKPEGIERSKCRKKQDKQERCCLKDPLAVRKKVMEKIIKKNKEGIS